MVFNHQSFYNRMVSFLGDSWGCCLVIRRNPLFIMKEIAAFLYTDGVCVHTIYREESLIKMRYIPPTSANLTSDLTALNKSQPNHKISHLLNKQLI